MGHPAGDIFGEMFADHQHMDILFINQVEEDAVRKVCQSFFTQR
jgi:hypothetical protein